MQNVNSSPLASIVSRGFIRTRAILARAATPRYPTRALTQLNASHVDMRAQLSPSRAMLVICTTRPDAPSSRACVHASSSLSSRRANARQQQRWAHRSRIVCRDADGASAPTDAAALNGKSVVIIGAGPAGALTSIHLASLGYEVDVYERRGASNKVETSARTYNVVLNGRGLDALDAGGDSVG